MSGDKGKGKGKAVQPSERDPLLGSSSHTHATDGRQTHLNTPHGSSYLSPRIRSIFFTFLLILASLLFSVILFFALLAYSFRPSPSELSILPKTAFKYLPPEDVQVLNVTEEGVLVNVTVRCGIDVDRALGIQAFIDDDEKAAAGEAGLRGVGAEWWEDLRRWSAHMALERIPVKAVAVNLSNRINVFPHHFQSPPLISVSIQSPLLIPLVPGLPPGSSSRTHWLLPVTFTALAKPLASTGQLWDYVQHAWADGQARARVGIDKVEVELPGYAGWRSKYTRAEREDVIMEVDLPLSRMPGLPSPGQPLNLSSLVHLQEYSFRTASESHRLHITARATLPNFLPDLNVTLPFGLPFAISLPPDDRMAEVITEPIVLNGSFRDIQLEMKGLVTAKLDENSMANSTSSLSSFLQSYLHGRDNPIIVSGLSSFPSFAPTPSNHPPSWLLSSLPSLSLPLNFPGPKPPPRIIQSVTIEHMRLSEAGGKMRATGTVVAEIGLPPGMERVDVDVVAVMPDVLVFDGPAPPMEDDEENIPAKAFGRIHPEQFLESTTEPHRNPLHPYGFTVRAPLSNVPLDVLPGRDKVLSDFVSKVVFKHGAEAGVKGVASVRVKVLGVEGTVRLDDLPVRGEFWVGRQRVLSDKMAASL